MDASLLLWLAAAALAVLGLAGLLLPAIPGAPVFFAGLFLAAWAEDFAYVGAGTLTVLGAMACLIYAVDFLAGVFGARRFGASPRGMAGAFLGGLLGLFLGLPGVLLGPLVGAILGELSLRRGLITAGRAGIGTALGLVLGAAAKLALAFSMAGLFAVVRLMPGVA